MEKMWWHIPKALALSYLHIKYLRVLTRNDVTVVNKTKKKCFIFFFSAPYQLAIWSIDVFLKTKP